MNEILLDVCQKELLDNANGPVSYDNVKLSVYAHIVNSSITEQEKKDLILQICKADFNELIDNGLKAVKLIAKTIEDKLKEDKLKEDKLKEDKAKEDKAKEDKLKEDVKPSEKDEHNNFMQDMFNKMMALRSEYKAKMDDLMNQVNDKQGPINPYIERSNYLATMIASLDLQLKKLADEERKPLLNAIQHLEEELNNVNQLKHIHDLIYDVHKAKCEEVHQRFYQFLQNTGNMHNYSLSSIIIKTLHEESKTPYNINVENLDSFRLNPIPSSDTVLMISKILQLCKPANLRIDTSRIAQFYDDRLKILQQIMKYVGYNVDWISNQYLFTKIK